MMATRRAAALAAVTLVAAWGIGAGTALGASAVIRVETTPPASSGSLRFEGLPAGEVSLAADGTGLLSAEVAAGSHVSTLAWIEPTLVDAGYRLTEVTCDDVASAQRSHGDQSQGAATFAIDEGETVTCAFRLAIASACTCPREGTWRVDNHPGSMACTGAMSMTMPLAPSRSRGKLSVNDGCTRIVAAGMSEDEADLEMAQQPDCSWLGTVGGSQDGIPMTITFRWHVESAERITGNLESTVSEQGMTCRMSRTYQLDFDE
jgi:hypothetical protein